MLAVILLIVHTIIAGALIWMVLLEMSKFAELGGAFGSGAAYTMFGRKKRPRHSGKNYRRFGGCVLCDVLPDILGAFQVISAY